MISVSSVLSAGNAFAQSEWQPARIPSNSNAQHISQYQPEIGATPTWTDQRPSRQLRASQPAASQNHVSSQQNRIQFSDAASSISEPASSSDQAPAQPLRWKSPRSASPVTAQTPSQPAPANPSVGRNVGFAVHQREAFGTQTQNQRSRAFESAANSQNQVVSTQQSQPSANPLRFRNMQREQSAVRTANYQQDMPQFPTLPFGSGQLGNGGAQADPAGPPAEIVNPQSSAPLQFNDSTIDPFGDASNAQPPTENGALGTDPMQDPEPAPGPSSSDAPSIMEREPATPDMTAPQDDVRSNPFGDETNNGSASDAEEIPAPDANEDDESDLKLPQKGDASSISCNEIRERVRARPIKGVSLDVSPTYGEGLKSVKRDTEAERLEFAASSKVRNWHDYKGLRLVTGRLVDLRNDRAILEVDGVERSIALMDLSDIDLAYIGDVWNIPLRCGTGNESYAGRNFIPSTVQWTAPGHCHKPLYFEQPQLERYGHDAGPIMQPIVSTAHFFSNIAVLPYKMGIHPPNECQYSLGYFRPGNCAPYMVQPVPLSLRGALKQAGFVAGAAALIP